MCPADGRARKFKKKSTIETARIQIAYIIQSTKKKETRHTDPFNNSKFLILPAVEFETSSYSLSLCFTNSVEKQRERRNNGKGRERERCVLCIDRRQLAKGPRERERDERIQLQLCKCAPGCLARPRGLEGCYAPNPLSPFSLSPLLEKKTSRCKSKNIIRLTCA